MKRIIALMLVLALLLCGCGRGKEDTAVEAPSLSGAVGENPEEFIPETTAEPTTVPTTEAVVYYNPLNGEILDAPFDGRIYASTIANTPDASIPHVSAVKADIVLETFVNGSVVRCLALFSDLSDVEAIGSTRSTRLMFNDIADHYGAILTHAGGVNRVIRDANDRGLTHYNVDSLIRQAGDLAQATAYRSKEYPKEKYGEYNLFVNGPGVMAYAESQGVQIKGLPEKDYGLIFAEDGTPQAGEDADKISVTITYNSYKKETIMLYDHGLGKYVYNQYGKEMQDLITKEKEAFENVVVMYTNITANREFQVADFVAGGGGYYACGGKIIPITWTCEGEKEPFRFFTAEGDPLAFGQGNTYIAITQPDSKVTYEDVAPPAETQAPETTANAG